MKVELVLYQEVPWFNSLKFSKKEYVIKLKFAVKDKSEVIFIDIVDSVFPLDQLTNWYPSIGVAVIETVEFSVKVPPELLTVPPSPAITDNVKLFIVGCSWATVGCSETGDSFEQARIKKNEKRISFLIYVRFFMKGQID